MGQCQPCLASCPSPPPYPSPDCPQRIVPLCPQAWEEKGAHFPTSLVPRSGGGATLSAAIATARLALPLVWSGPPWGHLLLIQVPSPHPLSPSYPPCLIHSALGHLAPGLPIPPCPAIIRAAFHTQVATIPHMGHQARGLLISNGHLFPRVTWGLFSPHTCLVPTQPSSFPTACHPSRWHLHYSHQHFFNSLTDPSIHLNSYFLLLLSGSSFPHVPISRPWCIAAIMPSSKP